MQRSLTDSDTHPESWIYAHLVCPRDHAELRPDGHSLVCSRGHAYPVVDGIPVLLLEEKTPTHAECTRSLAHARSSRETPATFSEGADGIDSFVQRIIAATSGIMYRPLINKLTSYPIPEIRLPPGRDATLLDIGCNWGRWTISAARKGYLAVGIDPSLEAVQAARNVAAQLGAPAAYLVADARHLPFPDGAFDVAFSYSVLQHFSKLDAIESLAEVGRILKPAGASLLQMPNKFALRNAYSQARRGFREPVAFEVRYWSPSELLQAFGDLIGPSSLSVDNYFSLGGQASDLQLLPWRYRFVVSCSELLRKLSRQLPFITRVADSLYVHSVKTGNEK